jgi:hypothetical protein
MILTVPAITKGIENPNEFGLFCMKYPFRPKPIDKPTDLTIFVIPLAAERSAGETTKVTKVWRAGTSICDIQKRQKSKNKLRLALLVIAISIRKTLEGR